VWVRGLVLVAFIDFDEIFKTINAPKCMCLMAHIVPSLYSANCSPELYNYYKKILIALFALQYKQYIMRSALF
jgi:hypothetical protein